MQGVKLIAYPIGPSEQVVILTEAVLGTLRHHRQKRWYQREAGGQLFARFDGQRIVIEEATGPRAPDKRSLVSFHPNRKAEQKEIIERHRDGLHYVGDWHTHPEDKPQASSTDVESIGECVTRSTHDLKAFILIVVGWKEPPEGLHVLIHDGKKCLTLTSRADGFEVKR